MIIFNGKRLDLEHFSNSECRIKDLDIKEENMAELIFETDVDGYSINEDLMNLLFVSNELKKVLRNAKLLLWCMPYQRMDRKCKGDIFTLEAICKYINWLEFSEVLVVEAHSDVTLKLLKNAHEIRPILKWLPKIKSMINFSENDCIVFPDKGATKRYSNLNLGNNIYYCEKERDEITNEIKKVCIVGKGIVKNRKCIIIDDLCSKGDTLFECYKILCNNGAKEVYIAVAHCEKTALSKPFFSSDSKLIKIFTSKSNMSLEHKKVEYMEVEF